MKALIITVLLLSSLMNFSVQNAEAAAKLELNMASGIVESHPLMTASYKNWLYPEVEKRTNGRMSIAYFNPNTICPEFEVYPSILKGVVDLGMQMTSRSPIPMPYMSAFDLPGIFRSPMATHIVPFMMLEKYPSFAKELEKFKIVSLNPVVPNGFASTKKQIKTIEDIKGIKVLSTSATAVDMISRFGGTPVAMAPTEYYLALQRGMADAALTPAGVANTLKLNEICPYFTQAFTTAAYSINFMSKKTWDSFPPDIQAALEPVFGLAASLRMGMLQLVLDNIIQQQLQQNGTTIYTLSPEELSQWRVAYEPMYNAWVADMEKKGHKDAQAFLDDIMMLSDKYSDPVNYLELYNKYADVIGTLEDAKQDMIKVVMPQAK